LEDQGGLARQFGGLDGLGYGRLAGSNPARPLLGGLVDLAHFDIPSCSCVNVLCSHGRKIVPCKGSKTLDRSIFGSSNHLVSLRPSLGKGRECACRRYSNAQV